MRLVRGLPRRWLLLCGAGSGVLHVGVYVTQRAIQRGPDLLGGLAFTGILAAYALVTCGLFTLYALVVVACQRGRIATKRERRLAILFPVLFNVALLSALPSLSIDVYSYLVHGYLQTGLDENPYVVGARAVADTSFGHEIAKYGWRPVHPISPYGPILTHLERAVVAVTRDVPWQIMLFKAVAVAAALGSAAVIWMLLGRVRPDQQLLGTIVFLWNPMIIWELAGEGHNDAVMILLVVLAMALILQERHTAGIAIMSLAVLTKYLPLMLVPLAAVYAWRTTHAHRRLVVRALLGTMIAATVTVMLFLPLWVGVDTFRGVRLNGAPGSTGSTPTILLEVLDRIAPHPNWQAIMWGLVMLASLICVTWQARRMTDVSGFLRAVAVVWLLYLLLISPTYWPWYATMVVALLALVPERSFLVMAFVVSLSSRLAAPLAMMFVHQSISRPLFLGSVWIIGVGMPLLMLALQASMLTGGEDRSTAGARPNA
jgi:alpha-1,6-mannosyltransferase